ncbi:hypothetical protein [Prosthecobacter sp.]|jgi:hypothetical protein|uniref:hypothetical protein n=1 Tax=Prosthecobacter sp. TaxID=1965333 RepID=UPI0037CC1CB8
MKSNSENRYGEFRELERTARHYLMHPDLIPKASSLDGWFLQLQLWHFPSFAMNRSWFIYQKRERGARGFQTLLRQTTWDYAADSQRFFEPLTGLAQGFHTQPTIEVRDRPLETAVFAARLSTLEQISFPAFCGCPGGIDGEFYGLAFPPPAASVWWWCDGPESWRSLTQWSADTRDWLVGIADGLPQPEQKEASKPRIP